MSAEACPVWSLETISVPYCSSTGCPPFSGQTKTSSCPRWCARRREAHAGSKCGCRRRARGRRAQTGWRCIRPPVDRRACPARGLRADRATEISRGRESSRGRWKRRRRGRLADRPGRSGIAGCCARAKAEPKARQGDACASPVHSSFERDHHAKILIEWLACAFVLVGHLNNSVTSSVPISRLRARWKRRRNHGLATRNYCGKPVLT